MNLKRTFSAFATAVILGMLSSVPVSAQEKFDAPPVDGIWLIKSVQAGSSIEGYWDQPGKAQYYKKGADIQTWSKEAIRQANDQNYHFVDAYNGWYSIASMNGDGLVDISGGKNSNGVNVQIFDPNSSASQKFHFKHLGGGRYKIYTSWGKIICTSNRQFKNGTKIVTWDDHNGPWTEWYFENVNTGKNYVPGAAQGTAGKKTSDLPGFDVVVNNLKQQSVIEQYFPAVTIDRFNADNAAGELQKALDKAAASDQWNAIMQLVPVIQKNKDIAARRSMLSALSQVAVKPGAGFAETMLRGPVKSAIQKNAQRETDAASKQYIEVLANKF